MSRQTPSMQQRNFKRQNPSGFGVRKASGSSRKPYAEVLKSGIHRIGSQQDEVGNKQVKMMKFVSTKEDLGWLQGTYVGKTYEI
ncbi:hypothetical protein Ancab_033621, partial [Ancistrocladus abbreviatus]